MKRFTTVVLGLGLLVGSTVSANDTIDAFYPEANSDTPDYLERKVSLNNPLHVLAKSSLSEKTVKAFYPEANNDAPDYLERKVNLNNPVHKIGKSSLSEKVVKAFYPEENNDSPEYLI